MSTLAAAVGAVTAMLRAAGVPSPAVDARWLVAAATGCDPRTSPEHPLGAAEAVLAALVERRCAREPLQLVIGSTAFRTIELRCRAGVFVPRPETEVLAGIALDLVRAAQAGGASPVVVHEPCTGTGAVGLAVASEADGAVVLLADRSEEAVALATENRDLLASAGRLRSPVEVGQGHLLDAFSGTAHPTPDVIVANPPYLPAADLPDLDPEVVEHDPHGALSGGSDGHELVLALLAGAAGLLARGGAIALEIDARRSEEVCDTARRAGLVDVVAHQDLTGAPRFVVARASEDGDAQR
jgi:release factor glutamine methyltransferase